MTGAYDTQSLDISVDDTQSLDISVDEKKHSGGNCGPAIANNILQLSPLTLRGPQHCAPGMPTRFQTILDYQCYFLACYINKSVQD